MIRGNSNRFGPSTDGARHVVADLGSNHELTKREQLLEQRIAALENELHQTRRDLKRNTQALKIFSRIISHNLRAPLRTMHGFSTLLERSAHRLHPADKSYTERIQISAARMEDTLRGLIAYGCIVAGDYPMEVLDPNPLMHSAIEKTRNIGNAVNAPIAINEPLPPVWANPTLLEVVFMNLLSNALKYVTPGILPRVIVSHEKRGGSVRLSIHDCGLGLSPELRQQLFGPLHALLAFSDTGAGLGLLRVQAAADRMNARLGVESTPAQGSRFWIELPENAPATS